MRIEISKNELLFDIRNKSHLEVAGISEADARYRVEAGSEKTDEIERDIITSLAYLDNIDIRYLNVDMTCMAENNAGLPDTIIIDLLFSERRLDGKVQPLTDAIHAFLVDNTLALFYASVSQGDLQTKRAGLAAADATLIENLIFKKKAPYIVRH